MAELEAGGVTKERRRSSIVNTILTKSIFRSGSALPSPADEFNDSRIAFSKLCLEAKPFAAGSAGQVYRGTYNEETEVAAKATFDSMFNKSNEELEQEFKVLSRLRHPNVLRFYGTAVNEIEDIFYLVTEYCGGGTLQEYATRSNPAFTPARSGDIIKQILSAVEYMHGVGLVHLDLKLLNVLLSHDGTVRICDLGAAQNTTTVMQSGSGTRYYMPPEAFALEELDKSYDSASWDIYSLSVMIVEMWNRGHPWHEVWPTKIQALLVAGERPDFPTPCSVSLAFAPPPDLRALVYSMWAKDPRARPEVAEVLETFQVIAELLVRQGSAHESWSTVDWESGLEKEKESFTEQDEGRGEQGAEEERGGGGGLSIALGEETYCSDEESGGVFQPSLSSQDSEGSLPFRMSSHEDFALNAGWHPESGTQQERNLALKLFWKKTPPNAVDMTRWYEDAISSRGSPWCLLNTPRKWKVEGVDQVEGRRTIGGVPNKTVTRAISTSTSTTFLFDPNDYRETVRLPLKAGLRRTRWIVCAYLSPTQRLVRCVDGFVSIEEEAFPFALATLRVYSLQAGDGGKRDGGMVSPGAAEVDGSCDVGAMAAVNDQEWLGTGFDGDGPPSDLAALRRARIAVFEVDSVSRGAIKFEVRDQPFRVLQEVGPGFYNVRVPFVMHGAVDIGSHLSMIRLKNAKILVLGAVDPNGNAVGQRRKGEMREDIDRLTRGGSLIEAVIATHPFHARFFEPFYAVYGGAGLGIQTEKTSRSSTFQQNLSRIKYYGTPRHLRTLPQIPWIGDVSDPAVQRLWVEDGVHMRVPAGTEFVDPQPPESNHLSSLLVYHERSKCVHNDDCFCLYQSKRSSMGTQALASLSGVKNGELNFHPSFTRGALTDPKGFQSSIESILEDWPMECLCTAHNGRVYRGANTKIRQLLEKSRVKIDEMASAMPPPLSAEERAERALTKEQKRAGSWKPFSLNSDDPRCECG
mmetsp:Transcript_30409/g.61903  ORF Transcript_30409/g.61903 Transcript_30409/m.61903 type:complete len:974 (+) Transcript_30409:172-3093(+)